jgi:hypothetical protein
MECTKLFRSMLDKFMQQFFLSSHHLLGNMKQYIIGYETQQHEYRKAFVEGLGI